jgi:hypothetical protein
MKVCWLRLWSWRKSKVVVFYWPDALYLSSRIVRAFSNNSAQR